MARSKSWEEVISNMPDEQLNAVENMCRTICEAVMTGNSMLLMVSRGSHVSVHYSASEKGAEPFREYVGECSAALMELLATAPASMTEH